MSRVTSTAEPQSTNVGDRSAQTASHIQPTRRKRFRLRLWLPLTPLWILLAPFALIAAPFLTLLPAMRTIAPYRAALAVGSVLLSLSGTTVEVNTDNAVLRIRIF
jgi:hypothetical protein